MSHRLLLKKNEHDSQLHSGEVRISTAICRKENFKRRDAIKITISGRSIIRELFQTNFKEDTPFIEMDYDSRKKLGITNIYGRQAMFDLKRVNKFRFYWHHPSHGIRLTVQIGVPALIVSVLSLVVAFYPDIIPFRKDTASTDERRIDAISIDTSQTVSEATAPK